jgi:outer membrane protein
MLLGAATAANAGPEDHVMIGAGAAVLPDFQGSDGYRIIPAPLIDVRHGRFFAQTGDGIGADLIDRAGFRAGVSVSWMRGYGRDDVPDGIGKLGGTVGGHAFVSWQIGDATVSVSTTSPVFGGDMEGVVVSGQLSYPVAVTGRLTISPSIGTSWANARYMRRYFGVDAEQAAASGLMPYRPSSGFKDISAHLTTSYRLADHISLIGVVLLGRNLDQVTDSPFVEQRWQPAGIAGIAYTF